MSEFGTADVLQISGDPEFVLNENFKVNCREYAKKYADDLERVIIRPSLNYSLDRSTQHDREDRLRYRRGGNPLPARAEDFGIDGAVYIPEGFRFDGASIPGFAAFLGKLTMNFDYTQGDPRLHTASVVHDWLYCTHQCEKYLADDLFFYMLLGSDVSVGDAWAMWEAVVFNGDSYWRGDREKKTNELANLCREVGERGESVNKYFEEDIIVASGLEETSAKA